MNVARLLLWAAFAAAMLEPGLTATRQAAAGQAVTPTSEDPQDPWGWLKMPTVTMPKVSWPKMPADPLAPVKSSARKVGDGGKKAWEGTKELFTGGAKPQKPATRVANAGEPPSMWDRLTGGKKEEPQGPQTVKEWMSQKRVD